MNAAGGFSWDEPDIAADLLSTLKALRVSNDEHKRQSRHGPNARMSHEESGFRTLLRLLLHSCRELVHAFVHSIKQNKQIISSSRSPRSEWNLFQSLAALHAPKTTSSLYSFVHCYRLQLIQNARSHLNRSM